MGGGSSKSLQSRSANANKPNNKIAIKVPLHAALRAVVLIQKRIRIKNARIRLKYLIEQKRIQDGAALKYLLDLQEKLHDQKSSPSKQAVNKFSDDIMLFNHNAVLETIGGDKIDVEDYHCGNRLSYSTTLINPTIGFVVKSKTVEIGRKVFINICHHEMLTGLTVKFSSPRLLSNTVTDNGVFDLNFENTIVFDVLISSTEYHNNFQYKQGLGVVPAHSKVKNKYSEMAISFLNSFEHSYSSATPHSSAHSPSKGKGKKHNSSDNEASDFKISMAYKIPKIRRGYVGEMLPLIFDLHSTHMVHSFSKPVDRPVKGIKKNKTNSNSPSLSPPPLIRSWVSVPSGPLEGQGEVPNIVTTGSFDLTRSGSDLGTRYSEPTVEERYIGSVMSATTVSAGIQNTKKSMNDLSDDDEEGGGLDDTQKEYFKQLNSLQSGLAAYITLNHGCLIVYKSINLKSVPALKQPAVSGSQQQTDLRINTAPFGRDEFMRLMLCDYQVSTLIDHSNSIFYVQLVPSVGEAISPQDRLLGMLSSRYPSGDASDSEFTVQCKSHAEMLTWKLLFTAHIEYAQQRLTLLQTTLQSPTSTTINTVDMSTQPTKHSSWLVRKVLNPTHAVSGVLRGVTQRVFSVLVLGVMNLYDSDASEDTLLESIPLSGKVVEMKRGEVDSRTDTVDVVVTLRNEVPDNVDEVQEFFFTSVSYRDDDSLDTFTALQRHIRFACCYVGAYLLPVVEFNHRLKLSSVPAVPPSPEGSTSTTPDVVRGNVTLGVVTMESAYREYVPAKREEEEIVVEAEEEEEVNSDDDEEDEEEQEMKRKAAADLLKQQQEAKRKAFNGVRERIFRCLSGTTNYETKSDANQFASDRNQTLSEHNSFDLVLADNKLCVYKAMCHIATINLVAPENVELVTAPEDPSAPIVETEGRSFNSPQRINDSKRSAGGVDKVTKFEDSKHDDRGTGLTTEVDDQHEEVFTTWQIVVIATNSLKYRLGFRCEQDYLMWLRVIDWRRQCPENVVVPPPDSPKKKRKNKHRSRGKGGSPRRTGTTSVSEMSNNETDEDDDEEENGSTLSSPKRKTLNEAGDSKVDYSSDKEDGEAGDAELVRAHGASKTASTLASFQNKLNIKGTNPVDATANNLDNNATKKYSRLMRPKESVVACGVVLKHEVAKKSGVFAAPSSGTRRMLLLTDLPRLIFIDPVSNIIRGHIELSKTARIEYKTTSGNDFEITVAGTTTKFTASDGPAKDAKFWIYKMKVATGK